MREKVEGGCMCGRVRYAVPIDDRTAYLCHCRMCQRASGNISLAMKNVKAAEIEWQSEPEWFASSPFAKRPFCPNCGTSLGFAFDEGENADITIASLDDPTGFTPTHHFGVEHRHEDWLDTTQLPGKRTDEHPGLVDRWAKSGMPMPK